MADSPPEDSQTINEMLARASSTDDATAQFSRLTVLPRLHLDLCPLPPYLAHAQLNLDVHARVMAFQQKRQGAERMGKPLPALPAKKDELSKKPLLLQRRGMKLKMDMEPEDKPALSHINLTGELARRLSQRKPAALKLPLTEPPDQLPEPLAAPAGPRLQGLFANYSKYVDIKSGLLNFSGKALLRLDGVDFSLGRLFHISLDELQFVEELGRGNYGTVSKVVHRPTGVLMAVKEVRLELEETKFAQILMELEVLHKCNSPYIVDFYGAFFVEGAVYMCMEYMDGGLLDKIYGDGIHNEPCLAYITECVIRGLKELKDQHHIIHRDVKPTNILVNCNGKVKLCDFGVLGNLVALLAKTNIGCQLYMAPERIKSLSPDDTLYLVQADVWLLGLTMLEVAKGGYPYPPETFDNIFSQLSAIVDGEPPKLDPAHFSKEAQAFVRQCLNKTPSMRPSYDALLQHPWLQNYRGKDPHMDRIVTERLQAQQQPKPPRESVLQLLKGKVAPALHRGGLSAQRLRRN